MPFSPLLPYRETAEGHSDIPRRAESAPIGSRTSEPVLQTLEAVVVERDDHAEQLQRAGREIALRMLHRAEESRDRQAIAVLELEQRVADADEGLGVTRHVRSIRFLHSSGHSNEIIQAATLPSISTCKQRGDSERPYFVGQ